MGCYLFSDKPNFFLFFQVLFHVSTDSTVEPLDFYTYLSNLKESLDNGQKGNVKLYRGINFYRKSILSPSIGLVA